MDIDRRNDERIIASWHTNAASWVDSVRHERIESRRLVTDRAVIRAVLSRAPRSVLDVGCGEGWLARVLAARGIAVIGTDIVPELIDQARAAGGGEFVLASYEQLGSGLIQARSDLLVCNFALLGKQSVAALLASSRSLLAAGGTLVIQTLHPLTACGEHPYRDGWREGSWAGFDAAFSDPPPWYFRTLESWLRLLTKVGLRLLEMREPLHPHSHRPASVIFIATPD